MFNLIGKLPQNGTSNLANSMEQRFDVEGEVAVNDSSQLNAAAVLRRSGEAMREAPVMREAMKLRRCKILNKNGNI